MGKRTELQTLLESVLCSDKVYYQPPETFKLSYPCIIYERSDIDSKFANDLSYIHKTCYSLTLIDKDPDSPILDKLLKLPKCSFDRHYEAANLNHDTFNIYY